MAVAHQWNRVARTFDPQARKNPALHYTEPSKMTSLWQKIPQNLHEEVQYEQQQVDELWKLLAAQYSTSDVSEDWLFPPSLSTSLSQNLASVNNTDSASSSDSAAAHASSFSSSSAAAAAAAAHSSSSAALPFSARSSAPATLPSCSFPASHTSDSESSNLSQPSFLSKPFSQPSYQSEDFTQDVSSVPVSIFSCSSSFSSLAAAAATTSSSLEAEQSVDAADSEKAAVTATAATAASVEAEGKANVLSADLAQWEKQEEEIGRVMSTGDVSNHLAFKEAVLKLQGLPADSLEVDLARVQGRGPNFNEFLVEHAKSGRATCSSCRKPIDQGTLRIANTYFAVGFDGNKYYWRHWWCFVRSQKNVNRPEQWDGWNRLKDADKSKILKLVPRPTSYGLTLVPGLVSCFRSAQKLDLRENSLEVLPAELSALQKLEKIDLNHNQFSSIPEVLLTLPNLRWIDLRNNPVASSAALSDLLQVAKQRNPLLKIDV